MKTKQSAGFFLSQNALSWLVYGLGALVLMLLQNAPHCFPVIGNARPTPLVLFVVCVALFEGPRIGAIIGVVAGLMWDLYALRLFGLTAVQLLIISVTVGLLVQWLLRTNFLSAMLLCAGGTLAQMLLEWLLNYALFLDEEAGRILVAVYLPNAAYTVLLSPLMYWLVLGLARFLRRHKTG